MSPPALAPAIAETHISTVAFVGERAYKLLKPLRNDFLDYSTAGARLAAVDAELALNRRLSPDVYLGTADVVEGGEVVDRMLVMRRLPADRKLSNLVATAGRDELIRQVAREVARFHSTLAPLAGGDTAGGGNSTAGGNDTVADIAGPDGLARNWEDNLATMAPFVGPVLVAADVEHVAALYRRYLDGRRHLLEQRIAGGLVRDGHGDLTAEDIFCLADGPRILDCLAFDRRLRISDVLLDIAFLAMDLERLAGPAASQKLMAWYGEYSGEHHPSSLAHHYVAYRAHVRAKVACLGHDQGQPGAAQLARTYHGLCLRHLRLAALRLVLVGGGPGTGKTTLAGQLSEELRWPVLGSDELRKDLTGHAHSERLSTGLDKGIYRPEITEETYRALLGQAEVLLNGGESVVLDASWSRRDHRDAAAALARRVGALLVEVECSVPPDTARQRISARLAGAADASDATPDLVEPALRRRDPWPGAVIVDTSADPSVSLAAALEPLLAAPLALR
ncbi:MAG: AAA family ATPase [Acidimicrobiia bacterium]|nr:AAA family ATPase [Acidimicrobiia bacterium]